MINIITGSSDKPVASQLLAEQLSKFTELEGTLYLGYPILGTPEGSVPIDALLITKEKGVTLIDLVESNDLGAFEERQDTMFNMMKAKLTSHRELMKRRDLQTTIDTITYCPRLDSFPESDFPLCNDSNLIETLHSLKPSNEEYYAPLTSVIQSISTLRRGNKRTYLKNPNSKGSKIKKLEDSIATLDQRQGEAVIETFDGVQRIRGLAGSGKTIVLALKVAYLHAKNPHWDIAVTFNIRSLKAQFEKLITTFVLQQTNAEPDWDKISIINAWGAPGGRERSGIYYQFCVAHDLEYYDFQTAKDKWGWDAAFSNSCIEAINNQKTSNPKFDAILVDEAQDFTPAFLRICYEFLKEPKRLVYAYDELQNLGSESLPPMEEIFGNDPDGKPRVTNEPNRPGEARQDIILDVCYRNSRPVLTTAHALGFGLYRDQGIVQLFDDANLWSEVGYEIVSGNTQPGNEVRLRRSSRSSPSFLEEPAEVDELIDFIQCNTGEGQAARLADLIKHDIDQQELTPNDIIVINPDPISTKRQTGPIRDLLSKKGIQSILAGVDCHQDIFRQSNKVTFTGIYRAKGNESPMVYIINAQDCFSHILPSERAKIRNRLFTAITRSKGWVRILGHGPEMDKLISEFEEIKKNNYELAFTYPTDEEREKIKLINRAISKEQREKIDRKTFNLEQTLASIENGEIHIADLPEGIVERLKNILPDNG